MATVKVKFRLPTNPDGLGTIFYQVIHNREVRQVYTDYRLFVDEWDAGSSAISIPANVGAERRNYLRSAALAISADIAKFKAVIARLDRLGETYSAKRVIEQFGGSADNGFIDFSRKLIVELSEIGKSRTAATYTTALNSFVRFLGDREVMLVDIDSNLMVEYETYLKNAGLCANTTSYYMRNLRAIYNRAVERGLTVQRKPFKHIYAGIGKTVKRAISVKVLRRLKALDLSLNPQLSFARDIFMFLFYTRGMSFIDMAYLKKSDLKNGILSYRRQKTNQQLFIKWEKPMAEIVAKYTSPDSIYLLPIIRDKDKDVRRQYTNASHYINAKLKELGERLGLEIPLTTYVARHSWASIAKSKNIPISVISDAMGHDSERTTRIYLASLDTSGVDKANATVIRAI